MAANRWLLLLAVPVLVVLAAVAFFAVRFASAERDEQAWVVHTYQVMDQIRTVLGDMQASEAGQRGYIITRRPLYLDGYKQYSSRLQADLDRYQQLTLDNPNQQRRVGMLRPLVRQRFAAADHTLSVAPAAGMASPELFDAINRGTALNIQLRTSLTAGIAEEQKLLDERRVSRQQAEQNEISGAILAAIIALGILLISAVLLVRSNVRLAGSENIRARQAAVLQATLENIRDGVAVFDENGNLVAFNRAFFASTGIPAELATTGTPYSQFADAMKARDLPDLENIPRNGDTAGPRQIALGERVVELYRSDVPGGGYLVACMDVSERVRNENIVKQAQKMEAIGHLTGGMAHDFNNLLQIISANLDLLVKNEGDAFKRAARLQAAVGAVERGARLTGQLLAFARRQALDPRSTNLGRLIQEMTDLLRRTLGERVEVESIVAGGLWNTMVDRSQVENAILNLAINARDAMTDGGKLTIEVANAFLDDTYARHHAEVAPGQYVMLAVSDTGHGMTPEVVARAFDPFFTTKGEGRGTGLGLSQVFGFVKQSGGHIKIYSEMGEGTTIKLYLPRSRKPQEVVETLYDQPIVGGKETILAVEDDDGVRAAVTDLLAELGYTVLKASNAEEALTVLRAGSPVDLLFTDVVMPGPISTRELARRAKDGHPNLRVLFTSGYTQNAIVHNGKLDEDVFLLSKPYRKDDLARKLRSLLDTQSPVPHPQPSVAQLEEMAKANISPAAVGVMKVLIVEDVALIRMTTVDMVESLGHTPFEAGDGPQALEILQQNPDIAVMVTDLGLPGMSGGKLVQEARKLYPALKIVVASGYSTEAKSEEELPNDVVFLPKPYNNAQLKRAVETA